MIPVSVEVVPENPTHDDGTVMNGAPGVKQVSEQVGPQLAVPPARQPAKKGGMHFEVLDNRRADAVRRCWFRCIRACRGRTAAAAEMSYRMDGRVDAEGAAAGADAGDDGARASSTRGRSMRRC